MNEDRKQANRALEFEHQDLRPKTVYAFLAGLALVAIAILLIVWGLYRGIDAYQSGHQPAQNPLVAPHAEMSLPETVSQFPQPRLEKNERLEINDFRLQEEQTLYSYGWVDRQEGIVRIPIDRAIELIAQRGLSTTPKAGTVPPSEVNVVKQAAGRADVSNLPAAKQPPRGKVKKQ
jgi:hypothetical protein